MFSPPPPQGPPRIFSWCSLRGFGLSLGTPLGVSQEVRWPCPHCFLSHFLALLFKFPISSEFLSVFAIFGRPFPSVMGLPILAGSPLLPSPMSLILLSDIGKRIPRFFSNRRSFELSLGILISRFGQSVSGASGRGSCSQDCSSRSRVLRSRSLVSWFRSQDFQHSRDSAVTRQGDSPSPLSGQRRSRPCGVQRLFLRQWLMS